MKNKYGVVSNFFGLIISIVFLVLLIISSNSVYKIIGSSLFCGFSIIYYIFKIIYLSVNKGETTLCTLTRDFFLLTIMGLNILTSLYYLKGVLGWVFFGISILITVIGVIFNSINTKKFYLLTLIVITMLMISSYSFLLVFTIHTKNLIIYTMLGLNVFISILTLLYSIKYENYILKQSYYIFLNHLLLGIYLTCF